jgi:hypothetical protein
MKTNIFKVFHYYRDKDEFIKQMSSDDFDWTFVFQFSLHIVILLFIYGFVIGIYHSFNQSISAGIKLYGLFLLSILICFPTFYVIQIILGSRMKLLNLVAIILSGALLSSWITVAFIPIVLFFMVTGDNYYFLQLLHIAIMAFASYFGMKLIIEALKYNCENENIYPKTGVTIYQNMDSNFPVCEYSAWMESSSFYEQAYREIPGFSSVRRKFLYCDSIFIR